MKKNQYDYRGGYTSNLPPELTPDNMVLDGTNWYWKGNLIGRPGWDNFSQDATIRTSGNVLQGGIRAYINNGWVNIVSIDDTSDVRFYYGDTGNYTEIQDADSAAYTFTTGNTVEMVHVDGKVIAVNGVDKPAIIYYDSGYIAADLEQYDVRTRTNDQWYAGLYDASATPVFVDDTTDAQSDTANDFQIAGGGTNNDGFYVAGVVLFTKVVITNCPQFDGSPVAEYAYYAGSDTWTTFSPTTSPNWTAAEADKTMEFDIPFDADGVVLWKAYGDVTTQADPTGVPGGVLNRYIIRIRFTTAPTSDQSADKLSVYHTQYLSQIFLNDKPQAVALHKDRVFLSAGSAFRFSPPNQVIGWDERDIEYCQEGGLRILIMVSGGDYLAVFKEAAIYRYYGTTTENFVLRKSFSKGCTSARGAVALDAVIIFTAPDGIHAIAGDTLVRLSRHIQTDYESWTKTNAVIINWDGNALLSFPSNSMLLWTDPDTIQASETDAGEGMLAFWKWSGLAVSFGFYLNGFGDDGVVVLCDPTNRRLVKNTANGYDVAYDDTQTAITNTLQTKYYSHDMPENIKLHDRVKYELSKSGNWSLTIYANNSDANATATLSSGTGTGHYYADISPPYTLDGYNLSHKLVNATTNAVVFYGFSEDVAGRAF